MATYEWYQQLVKPSWAPPAWLFAPVWTALYVLIAVSFGYVFWRTGQGIWPRRIAVPFAINLIANALFTPLQFGVRSNVLAALDIVVVLVTIIWAMWMVYPYARWVAYVQAPYLLWVLFATALQFTVTYLNWSV